MTALGGLGLGSIKDQASLLAAQSVLNDPQKFVNSLPPQQKKVYEQMINEMNKALNITA